MPAAAFPPRLGTETIDQIRSAFGLSTEEFAALFHVSRPAVAQWRERGIPVTRAADVDRVRELAEVFLRKFIHARVPQIVRTPSKGLRRLSSTSSPSAASSRFTPTSNGSSRIHRNNEEDPAGGTYYRVCDPTWIDPLDTNYAKRDGGRWNSPNEFGVSLPLCDLDGIDVLAELGIAKPNCISIRDRMITQPWGCKIYAILITVPRLPFLLAQSHLFDQSQRAQHARRFRRTNRAGNGAPNLPL